MARWEHKSVLNAHGIMSDSKLDELGNNGWELCAVIKTTEYAHIGGFATRYFFKRELET